MWSPSVYAGFISWTVLFSNPLMMLLGYTAVDRQPGIDEIVELDGVSVVDEVSASIEALWAP